MREDEARNIDEARQAFGLLPEVGWTNVPLERSVNSLNVSRQQRQPWF